MISDWVATIFTVILVAIGLEYDHITPFWCGHGITEPIDQHTITTVDGRLHGLTYTGQSGHKIKNKNASNGKCQNTFSRPEQSCLYGRCLDPFSSSGKTQSLSAS